jgi:PAS domain S-box-containing protein
MDRARPSVSNWGLLALALAPSPLFSQGTVDATETDSAVTQLAAVSALVLASLAGALTVLHCRHRQRWAEALRESEERLHRQRQTEEALRESEERIQLALSGADLGLWDWDIPTGLATYNARWAEMLGYRLDEIEHTIRFWQRIIHPEDRYRVLERFQAHMKRELSLFESEFRVRCQDASFKWVLCRGKVLKRDDEGRPLRAAGTTLDINRRHRAEEALRDAKELLELKVAERTRELAGANNRLRELDRLKSQFLATMSHELRTPLNSILGFTSVLLMELPGPLNEEQAKQLGMVHSSSKLLLSLINDLLDLSRIESGKMEVYRQWFTMQEIVEEVCRTLEPMWRPKGLAVNSDVPAEPVRVFSDRKKCYQILLNLVNNAVKFTEQGSVTLACTATETQVEVAVRDTGIGIKDENMGLLFEAFRQVDGSARRHFEGSGLGLHLCKRLLGLLNGEIEADSEFGRGSCFTFRLPLSAGEAHETQDPTRRGQQAEFLPS